MWLANTPQPNEHHGMMADRSMSSTPDFKETLTWPDTEEGRLTGSRSGPGGFGRGRGVTNKGEKASLDIFCI